ncbi:ABC transporter ATP-binding protein [Leptospira sp. GIMC2001]|uniref:ABC transporter ATP-binding protein n=1 Tax=Leptospira sp. GIMC2001 TaxID=1513297 RepID=UPI0023490CCF|nr:ABC transporter ATP-binding protein [Leptospira sp. GIMC2001]WCL51122.1 ABC transporter ATP-binding protein [Leptospira sp. GIMC2001]
MEIISVTNLSYSIGAKVVLKNVNFALKKGEAHALRGDNGVGKSTILKILLNYSHFPNEVRWNQTGNTSIQTKNLISFLGHELGLYSSLSLEENLRFFYNISLSPFPWSTILDWVHRFNLHRRLDDPIFSFSRGMKQKAALIRTLLSRSELILLDEPFTGLDETSYRNVLELLQEILKDSTIFAVIHGMEHPIWKNQFKIEKGGKLVSYNS